MSSLSWEKKTLENGVEQYVSFDEDSGVELMMLPTDLALLNDPSFRPWVKKYAEDKDMFFRDFAKVFATLIELGIQRDGDGKITNDDNEMGGYISAPKKSRTAGNPEKSNEEAQPLKEQNEKFRARL